MSTGSEVGCDIVRVIMMGLIVFVLITERGIPIFSCIFQASRLGIVHYLRSDEDNGVSNLGTFELRK